MVQFAGDLQARLGRRRRNEVDDRLVTNPEFRTVFDISPRGSVVNLDFDSEM